MPTELTVKDKIELTLDSLQKLLIEKNRRYGNAALTPLGVFNKQSSTDGILIRLDDKLQRVKSSHTLRRNDVADLLGYLTLLCIDQNWTSFDDLID